MQTRSLQFNSMVIMGRTWCLKVGGGNEGGMPNGANGAEGATPSTKLSFEVVGFAVLSRAPSGEQGNASEAFRY